MTRDATWVFNPYTNFELDMTYRSKFHHSNPQKALLWPERRIMTYCAWGCVQRCDLWAWQRKQKKRMSPVAPVKKQNKKGQKLSCVKLAICPDHHVDIAPEILRPGSCPGSSYIIQIS